MNFYRGLDNEMHRMPEPSLDPPERPEWTEAEYREHRAALLRALTSEEIEDMACDSGELGRVLYVAVVFPYADGIEPHPLEAKYLLERVREILIPKLEQHLEASE